MLGPTFVAMRARMPTQSVSVLNTVSARDTDVGGNSETESPATRGPLEAVRYGVPVNTLPCVFEKNTSKRTFPPPPVHMSAAAAVAVTESTDDFPNPGGRKNCRDTVESVWGIPPSTLNDFTESLAERKLNTSTFRMTRPCPQAATSIRRAAVRAFMCRPLIDRDRRGHFDGPLPREVIAVRE